MAACSAEPRIAPGTAAEIGPANFLITRALGIAAGGHPPNPFTTLARHRRLFRPWLPLLRDDELIELCMLAGHYEMLAMTLNTLRIAPDPLPDRPPLIARAIERRRRRARSRR
jgi:hypothetical protein